VAPALLQAVLIDLDGTLLDTAPDLACAANALRREHGLAELSQARVAQFIGKGTDRLIQRTLSDSLEGVVPAEQLAPARASFEAHYRRVNGTRSQVFAGVPEALRALRAAGLALACVTNKPREFTLVLLERCGLLPALDIVVAGDDVARRKPHPDLVLAACAQLGRAPQAAVLIGDSDNDAQAAHAAGSASLLVETGYNEGVPVHTLLGAPGVNGIFPTLLDAASWVLESRRG